MSTAESIDTTADTTQPDDALSPTLRRLRDAILASPALTPAEALEDARELLADHARELADAQETRTREIGNDMRKRGDRSRVAYCGGRDTVTKALHRYADNLDQTADGGS
ncbi:hypothetical protein [Streptomyces sp. NPDC020983]|uniref:hypothetical protein n=1 Tax=Streptomyces sp. NPDC020983 TaxID=3365106 RepID=UPI00379F1E18